MLCALNPFKMILFWGLKKFPLRREIPALKDHLNVNGCKLIERKTREDILAEVLQNPI